MKVQQENLPYRPITIVLEKQSEAKALFDLMNKLERYYSHDGETFHHTDFTPEQRVLIIKLCTVRYTNIYI